MITAEQKLVEANAPSMGAIIRATLIALAVALVILFTAVLPAEYGIDYLHTGKLLGLSGIAQATSGSPGRAIPVRTGIYTPEPGTYKVSTEDIGLRPGEGFEIKYHMQKGATMVFAWKADGNVQYEFHGEPDQKPRPDYYESYALDNKAGTDHFSGTFIAPSTGVHGWFWQNKGTKEVRMHLSVSGFFDSSKMFEGGAAPEDLIIEDPK